MFATTFATKGTARHSKPVVVSEEHRLVAYVNVTELHGKVCIRMPGVRGESESFLHTGAEGWLLPKKYLDPQVHNAQSKIGAEKSTMRFSSHVIQTFWLSLSLLAFSVFLSIIAVVLEQRYVAIGAAGILACALILTVFWVEKAIAEREAKPS